MTKGNNSVEKLMGARIYKFAYTLAVLIIICGYTTYALQELGILPSSAATLLWSLGILSILLAPSILLLASSLIVLKKDKRIGYSGFLSFIVLIAILLYYTLLH